MWTIIIPRLIFICFFGFRHFQYVEGSENGEDINWKFENESSLPASNVSVTFGHNFLRHCGTYMKVYASDVTDNLTVFAYAIPYVKSELDCPSQHRLTEHLDDLRRHRYPLRNSYTEFSAFEFKFRRVFTGCYYVVMKNDEGKNWIIGPKFYETKHCRYFNTKLAVKKLIVKPDNTERSKELVIALQVPLPCIGVMAWLYEEEGRIDNVTYGEMKNRNKTAKQTCEISRDAETLIAKPCIQLTDAHLEAVRGPLYTQADGEWTMVIKWTNLTSGGNTYFLRFAPQRLSCYSNNTELYNTVLQWDLVVYDTFCDLGYLADDDRPSPVGKFPFWIWISIEMVIAVALLAYWIVKFSKLAIERKHRKYPLCGKPPGTFSMFNEEESNQILLIYVRSSGSFTEAMRELRRLLAQNCQCRVHDLYATDEWDMVGGLGATGWFEKLLKDGSKVVLVDTPQFRSWLNGTEDQQIANDFRDHAVPYAVSLVTSLFQNATTQYRRHFVVRMEGFEVDDGQDDPLLVVSPHARYCLPKHLDLLCDHLKSTPQPSRNSTVEV